MLKNSSLGTDDYLFYHLYIELIVSIHQSRNKQRLNAEGIEH